MKVVLVSLLAALLTCQPATSIEGCLRYADAAQTICVECDLTNLYYLSGSSCGKAAEPNCQAINDNGKCNACKTGHFVSMSKCVEIAQVENCGGCSHNGKGSWCAHCNEGHLLVKGVCAVTVANCAEYDKLGHCVGCIMGHKINRDKKCDPQITGCTSYLDNNRCAVCGPHFAPNVSKNACLNTVENCSLYTDDGSCAQCSRSFVLSLDKSHCMTGIPNCLALEDVNVPNTNYKCAQCADGFKPNSNKNQCLLESPECQKWNASNNELCDECPGKKTWNEAIGSCITAINRCSSYTVDANDKNKIVCLVCDNGYLPSNNGLRCVPSGTCPFGFTFCPATQKCVKVPNCCATSDDCGNCLSFKSNFSWCPETNSCYRINSACPTSTDCRTGKCRCPGKAIWKEDTQVCVQIPWCCEIYDSNGNCLMFRTGFNWCDETKRCYRVPVDCPYSHDCVTRKCLCPIGFKFSIAKKVCVPAAWCCKTVDADGTCTEYMPGTGWSQSSKKCFKIPSRCPNDFDPDTGLCRCSNGYSWCPESQDCVKIPSCCAKHDKCGRCTKFSAGKGWCGVTNSCVDIPSACPFNFNCSTRQCECPSGQIYNYITLRCQTVPECCINTDRNGNCVSFESKKNWCPLTKACYSIPDDCPANGAHNCATEACSCPGNSYWHAKFKVCAPNLSCCLKSDSAGKCLQFRANRGFCEQTGMCYRIPSTCPDNHDCVTGRCVCPPKQVWSHASKTCVDELDCCLRYNRNGVCTRFRTGTAICPKTGQCYNIPTECPSSHDCETGQCTCCDSMTWCPLTSECVAPALCCEQSDACGNCIIPKSGFSLCPATNQCVQIPSACPFSHNNCGSCTCDPLCQTWCASQEKCVKIPPFCDTHDDCGNCLSCKTGYYLVSTECLPPIDIPHCAVYNSNHQSCQNCELFYEPMSEGKLCIIENCQEFSLINGECTDCQDGYTLTTGTKLCFAIINECLDYQFDIFSLDSVCLSCSFPYQLELETNACIIPRCLEYDLAAESLTCKTCINQELRSPDGKICYPAIEKCIQYSVTEFSYACVYCTFGYELSPTGFLCVPGVYNIFGYNMSLELKTSAMYGVNMDTSMIGFSYDFVYGLLDPTSIGSQWYLFPYDNDQTALTYTIRLQLPLFDSSAAFYLAAAGNSVYLQDYFATDLNIRWFIESANLPLKPSVKYIKSVTNGLYLDYNLQLTPIPTAFYFE
jgi:hypothetical protein